MSLSSGPSPTFLDSLASLKGLRPDTWYLIAAAASTALGHGDIWVPAIYQHAKLTEKSTPSHLIIARLKETLLKSTILIGLPRAINASFALRDATVDDSRSDSAASSSFPREGIDATAEGNYERGCRGLERVYGDSLGPMRTQMAKGMPEMCKLGPLLVALERPSDCSIRHDDGFLHSGWLVENIVYGIFLAPTSDLSPASAFPLSFSETESIILACLIPQRVSREITWHLRGCLKAGMSAQEVDAVQILIEMVATEIGEDVREGHGVPRVWDVLREGKNNS